MPVNYLGPHEERAKLAQPGTTWVPRAGRDMPRIVIETRADVPGRSFLDARIFVRAAAGETRKAAKSMSLQSLLGTYQREDEKPYVAQAKAKASDPSLAQLREHVRALEQYLESLGFAPKPW